MNEVIKREKKRWRGEFFSARYFLTRALGLGVLFLLAHAAGLREHTTFLSGTAADPGTNLQWSTFYGMIYILLYLGAVVAAPILVLASGWLALWQRYGRVTPKPKNLA